MIFQDLGSDIQLSLTHGLDCTHACTVCSCAPSRQAAFGIRAGSVWRPACHTCNPRYTGRFGPDGGPLPGSGPLTPTPAQRCSFLSVDRGEAQPPVLSFEPYNSTITLGPGHEPFPVEKPKDGASVPESASLGCFGGGRAAGAWGWSSGAGRRGVTQTARKSR